MKREKPDENVYSSYEMSASILSIFAQAKFVSSILFIRGSDLCSPTIANRVVFALYGVDPYRSEIGKYSVC